MEELLRRIEQEGFEIEKIDGNDYLIKNTEGKEAVLTYDETHVVITDNDGMEIHVDIRKHDVIIADLLNAMEYDFE